MEEDYLAWKDGMWEAFSTRLSVEEGGAGDVADFLVTEIVAHPPDKVYHGELSPRALVASASGTTTPVGAYDAKNPYPAPVLASKELFAVGGDRNCVHIEFDTTGSGMTYQHGDHVGVWPSNPDVEVDRMLSVLGLGSDERRHAIVAIESLDPALAKVPFPTPATYDAIFRHYLDISAVASRQTIAFLSRFAPTEEAREKLNRWGTNKEAYASEIDGPALKLAEVLQAAVGDSLDPPFKCTVWPIPFDRIVSSVPRLQPRYYSISSSSKLHPSAIHVTAVVLKYQSTPSPAHKHEPRWVFGLSTNFILNVKNAASGTSTPVEGQTGLTSLGVPNDVTMVKTPSYRLAGPRGNYVKENVYRVPIHVRRSTFRLPTSPKVPVIMIGPGTVSFHPAMMSLGNISGCRPVSRFRAGAGRSGSKGDRKEWTGRTQGLGTDVPLLRMPQGRRGLFVPRRMAEVRGRARWESQDARCLLPRVSETGWQYVIPPGCCCADEVSGKVYVQDLLWDVRSELAQLILDKRAYIYICGDAKNMSKAVEDRLTKMLAEAKGGSAEVEGAKELKLLKERNVSQALHEVVIVLMKPALDDGRLELGGAKT
jgi:NADPH-ferrihemoprotein reductase